MTSLCEVEQQFWAKVQRCNHGVSCRRCHWDWHGARNTYQYGVLSIDGVRIPAMRVALILAHGAELLPFMRKRRYALHALHRCDRPPCVNYAHGFWGTAADNMHDEQVKHAAFMERRCAMTRMDLDRLFSSS